MRGAVQFRNRAHDQLANFWRKPATDLNPNPNPSQIAQCILQIVQSQIARNQHWYCLPSGLLTSLSKVIWEEGRVAALSHTYAVKSSIGYNGAPQIRPQKYPSRGPIAKPHYLPKALNIGHRRGNEQLAILAD